MTLILDVLQFVLLCNSVRYITCVVDTLDLQRQAYIQTNNHLTYIVGDVNGIPLKVTSDETYSDLNFPDGGGGSDTVQMDPPYLDFNEQSVGMPSILHVTVHNLDIQNSLHLLSISGSTAHFHCSFFQDKTVSAGGNTTFDVVFLARREGNVENTLYIHTSHGSYKYQVFGVGVENPYRLRPYLGARVPINTTFNPVISIHNPHSSTLQVLEMYSSAGDLHFELLSGEKDAKKCLWEIPPYETKSVMRACFIGRVASNHTAFIRIKTNQSIKDLPLILPMEVEVTTDPGLYSPQALLDFGILRSQDEPSRLTLNLINSAKQPIQIASVIVCPWNDAIIVDFRPLKLQADRHTYTAVAQVTYTASKAVHPRQLSGYIVVKTKNSQHKLSIPYRVRVLHGSLVYNLNSTHFFSPIVIHNITRHMSFTNTFNFSIVIYNVTLPKKLHHLFSIINFNDPVTMKPQETVSVLQLLFHPNDTRLHLSFKLTMSTNVSYFNIPVVVYNGLFNVIHHRPEKYKGQLDFGTLGTGENRSMTFTVRNDNPVDLVCGEVNTNMNNTMIELLGIERGNSTTLMHIHNVSLDLNPRPLRIKPYHFAVFRVNLIAPDNEGSFTGEVYIVTQFQDLFIPITFRTSEGSLRTIPDKLIFDKSYPGRSRFKVLKMVSSFMQKMEVREVLFRPPDPRFVYVPPPSMPSVTLLPKRETIIGRLYFHAARGCGHDCYVGLPRDLRASQQWLLGTKLRRDVADTDQYMYTRLQQKWADIVSTQQTIVNVTIEVDTNEVRGFLFSAQAQLHWPSLVRKCKIRFPLTQIGNISISDFIVENSGDGPVVIQVLPLSLYPNPRTVLQLLNDRLSSDISDFIETDDLSVFTLQDLDRTSASYKNMTMEHRKKAEARLNIQAHIDTIVRVLDPGEKVRVRVGFRPVNDASRTSVILIRNNLTIMDAVVVQGMGARGEMKFSNRRPSSALPLVFDMTERHLKNCDKKKQLKNMMPHFTVRRTFAMRNVGELPFYVSKFTINGVECEGYGFRVLDCSGFDVLPNTSHKIDIAFTPDFTMSRIRRDLSIHTTLGLPSNFTLQATIPSHMLSRCAAALPRPNWEPILYYSLMCIMNFLLFCILVAAYFEADRIFVADILKRKLKFYNTTQLLDKGKVFDLKNLPSSLNCVPTSNINILKVNLDPVPPAISLKSTVQSSGHVDYAREPKTHFLGRFFRICLRACMLSVALFSSNQQREHEINVANPELLANNMTKSTIDETPQELTDVNPINNSMVKSQGQTHYNSTVAQNGYIGGKTRKGKVGRKQHNDLSEHSSTKTLREEHHRLNPEHRTREDNKVSNHSSVDKLKNGHKKLERLIRHDVMNHLWIEQLNLESDFPIKDINHNKHDVKSRRKISNSAVSNNKLGEKTGNKEKVKQSTEDKDETSSTTTDSSSLEMDDKNTRHNSAADVSKSKHIKTKSKIDCILDADKLPHIPDAEKFPHILDADKLPPVTVTQMEDIASDDDFILTTKSKTHKKVRASNKDVYGGNSSIDLPYNVDVKSVNCLTPISINDPLPIPASITEKTESPKQKEDLNDLSIQTDNLSHKLQPPSQLPASHSFSPDSLSSSSRSSSYSSIVSSGSADSTKQRVVKCLSDPKKPSVPYQPFGDVGLHVPVIGLKTPKLIVSGGGLGTRTNTWTHRASAPATPDPHFGLQSIPETLKPTMTIDTSDALLFKAPMPSKLLGLADTSLAPSYEAIYEPQQATPTMMQELQAERRRRVKEHQMRLMKEEWPGFGTTPVPSNSLWDAAYTPTDASTWSTNTDSPPHSLSNVSGLWETPTTNSTGWNNLNSIWNTNKQDNFHRASDVFADSMVAETVACGSFDPFGTLGDIWGPKPNNCTASNTWNYTLGTSSDQATPNTDI